MDDLMLHEEWIVGNNRLRGTIHLPAIKCACPTWMVFCHGFTGSREGPGYLFIKMSRALSAVGIGSLRFDFSGCAESDGLFSQLGVGTMGEELKSAIDRLRTLHGAQRVVALGHSLGATVAAMNAMDAQLAGLVFLAPVAIPANMVKRRTALIEKGTNRSGFYENGAHEVSPAFFDELRTTDPVAAISGFNGPILVVSGTADSSISVAEASLFAKAQNSGNSVQLEILDGCDHGFSTVRDADRVCSLLVQWFKENYL